MIEFQDMEKFQKIMTADREAEIKRLIDTDFRCFTAIALRSKRRFNKRRVVNYFTWQFIVMDIFNDEIKATLIRRYFSDELEKVINEENMKYMKEKNYEIQFN